jgi:AbrB family looped-hinge helix DNA binding protein
METSVLTSKGQLLIPKRLREKYGIEPGAKVILEETPQGVLVKALNANYIDEIIERVSEYFPDKKEYTRWKNGDKALENRFVDSRQTTYKKRKTKSKTK